MTSGCRAAREIAFRPVSGACARGIVAGRAQAFPIDISMDEWHSLNVTILRDTMTASVDGRLIGSFSSSGIAHESAHVLRLLVSKKVTLMTLIITRRSKQRRLRYSLHRVGAGPRHDIGMTGTLSSGAPVSFARETF